MNSISAIWGILTAKQRWQFGLLAAVNVVATVAEVLSVFSVLPFLALAGDPTIARSQPMLRRVWGYFGIETELQFVMAAGVLTFVSILITNAVNVGALWYRTWFCNSVITEMSDQLFRGYLRQPYSFFLAKNSAVLGKDLLSEIQAFYTHSLESITIVLARGLQVLAVAFALFVFDWKTAFAAAAIFGGFYLVVYVILKPRIHACGVNRYLSTERRYRLASEALGGAKEVQVFGRQEWYSDAFRHECLVVAATNNRLALYSLTPRFVIEVLVFGALVALVLFKMSRGQSFQQLLPGLGVFAVAGLRLLPTVQLLFQYVSVLLSSSLATQRLSQLFVEVNRGTTEQCHTSPASAPMRLTQTFAISHVTYRYADDKPAVLRDINLKVHSGECVGICGPSGSGKTTLVDLCLGLIQPTAGTIAVDGTPLSRQNQAAWQRNIGYVPQSIYLIDGTIAANIAFGINPNAIDMAAVERAARLAHLDEFIEREEDGYQTLVGERGVRLSGGQRQRVAIARALYRDPDVLFFDEATSALDADSEAQVVEAIQSLAHLKTIVVVAHRLSTLRYCDTIHTINAGRIVRSCNYAELVNHPL